LQTDSPHRSAIASQLPLHRIQHCALSAGRR
jgi:hypothetical protein